MLLPPNHHSCHFLPPVCLSPKHSMYPILPSFRENLLHDLLRDNFRSLISPPPINQTLPPGRHYSTTVSSVSYRYMKTCVERKSYRFLLFSLTLSSDTRQAYQRHLNLPIVYLNGHLLWPSPKSCKMLLSTTLQTYCIIDQGFSKCGPWTCSISLNWRLVRNAKSWAPSQTYWTRISGIRV